MAISEIDRVLKLHRAQLAGLVEIRGVRKMRPIYEQARTSLQSKLRGFARGKKQETYGAHMVRATLLQVEDAIRTFNAAMVGHLDREGVLARTYGSRHAINEVKRLEHRFTGATPVLQTDQVAVLQSVHKHVEPMLLKRYRQSAAFYTAPVVRKIQEQLALSVVSNETVDDAVERVAGTSGVFEGERWRAERIVRTELAYSYGVAKQRTMVEMRDNDMPDLQKKLIATFDNRTGEDSKKLHGQVQNVDQPFVWVKPSGERIEYMAPPNRPNDREIVIPWRPGWTDTASTEPDPTEPPGPVTPSSPP